MNFVFEQAICKCGSKTFYKEPQKHDEDGNWTTLAQRREDPSIKIPSAQKAMYVSDPTWFTCKECGEELDADFCSGLVSELWEKMGSLKVKEEIGISVINTRGVKSGNNKKKKS